MNVITNDLTFNEFAAEVKAWTWRNFGPRQQPFLGMVEELGELSRCVLKRHQGIRSYDDPIFFAEHYVDAIGDIGVYAGNYAARYRLHLAWPDDSREWIRASHSTHIAFACKWLARLGRSDTTVIPIMESWLRSFLYEIDCLAKLENTTLQMATRQIWSKVKARDWNKNKIDGI